MELRSGPYRALRDDGDDDSAPARSAGPYSGSSHHNGAPTTLKVGAAVAFAMLAAVTVLTALLYSNSGGTQASSDAGGCSGGGGGAQSGGLALDPLRWDPRNVRVLSDVVTNATAYSARASASRVGMLRGAPPGGVRGRHLQDGRALAGAPVPYAVFDWDNTNAMFDLQENTLLCQVDDMWFNLSPSSMRALLQQDVPFGHECTDAAAGCQKEATMRSVMTSIGDAFEWIYHNYVAYGAGGKLTTLDAVHASSQWQDFSAQLVWLYGAMSTTYGDAVAYTWVLTFGGNRTVASYTDMVNTCVRRQMGVSLQYRTLVDSKGQHTTNTRQGLRTIAEMAELHHACEAHGVTTFIVSASLETAVAAFATSDAFAYSIPRERVIGMRLAMEPGGVLGTRMDPNWPVTYRAGKVEAIRKAIVQGLPQHGGRGPILAGGDSDTDFEMLTGFEDTQLRLVFNRIIGGDLIGALSRQAVAEAPLPNPSVILQGRDENLGVLRPASASILLGEQDPKLLPDPGRM